MKCAVRRDTGMVSIGRARSGSEARSALKQPVRQAESHRADVILSETASAKRNVTRQERHIGPPFRQQRFARQALRGSSGISRRALGEHARRSFERLRNHGSTGGDGSQIFALIGGFSVESRCKRDISSLVY